ncbi:MAG: hypothetical protein QXH67_01335 [Candidatus Bathyarchaeia archaeon]
MRIRKFIGILTIATLALNLVLPMVVEAETVTVDWSDPADWYMTVNGVLHNDYYVLYPYELRSLKIGFSKYGEMINTLDNVGLEYHTVDPFAPPGGSSLGSIAKFMWVQGWLINITYYHSTKGLRNVWAAALHGDSTSFGGPWLRVDFMGDYDPLYGYEDPRDPGYVIGNYAAGGNNYGGRKTNGTAYTYPIQVLYDGPRRFVAQLATDIYDHPKYLDDDTSSDIPLVRLIFTIIFNKVKKEVNIIKDVKSLLSEKISPHMKVQFSNRGEVDLGNEDVGYHSYFHFYTEGVHGVEDTEEEGLPTVYNSEWTLLKTQDPKNDGNEPPAYRGLSAAGPFPQDTNATFDVATAINPRSKHVWFAAFWPSLSDWNIDGWEYWWRSLDDKDPHYIDAAWYHDPTKEKEPKIPFYIGEWDFVLKAVEYAPGIQFRGVTMYGVVNQHDALDDDMDGKHGEYEENIIDREVMYYLDETFNPWDLLDAVHKHTMRWVEFKTAKSDGTITLDRTPIEVPDDKWDQYCVFSERVIDLDENYELEARDGYAHRGQDTYIIDGKIIKNLDAGHKYKILYSTGFIPPKEPEGDIVVIEGPRVGRYEWIVVGKDAASVDSVGAALVAAAFKNKILSSDGTAGAHIGIAGEDIYDPDVHNRIPWVMRKFAADYGWEAYRDSLKRAALNDDWCKSWPVSSSNMIFIGGAEPWINLGAYYFNDFTDAFSDFPGEFTLPHGSPWAGKIIALPCWSKMTYSSSESTGYAVIATYKDINGTVGFLVYGHWGRDTYYACQWLHGDEPRKIEPGIEYLQKLNPGVTSIILKITYPAEDPFHPTFSIVEHLGTKTEKLPIHEDP